MSSGWWFGVGGVVVGLVVGLAVLRDEKRARRLADIEARKQAKRAAEAVTAPPSSGDWVPRAEMVRLAHLAEVAEARAEQAEERLEELRRHPSGGAS